MKCTVGTLVEPFSRSKKRDTVSRAPRFYLFDVGLAGLLAGRSIAAAGGPDFGRAFEHFVFMELRAYLAYSGADLPVHYWRTFSGQEVDFVLGDGDIAIEAKSSQLVRGADLRGLGAFMQDYAPRKVFVVTNELRPRMVDKVHFLPWREFLDRLWAGDITR